MLSKPITTDPELLALLERARAMYDAMSLEDRRTLHDAQRRSWVIGEMMLEHPDMSREQAESLFDQII
ncbi:MAG TPA: hypothetical protein VGH23_16400 [Rhizomicrobium sp.]|jgi:hypothetical protein